MMPTWLLIVLVALPVAAAAVTLIWFAVIEWRQGRKEAMIVLAGCIAGFLWILAVQELTNRTS